VKHVVEGKCAVPKFHHSRNMQNYEQTSSIP